MFSWCHLSIHFFFFFKQKTAYDMRISDWSSDVCSSDLSAIRKFRAEPRRRLSRYEDQERRDRRPRHPAGQPPAERAEMDREWRRAVRHRTDRKSVVYGKSVSVRVDLGGRRFIIKTTHIRTKKKV